MGKRSRTVFVPVAPKKKCLIQITQYQFSLAKQVCRSYLTKNVPIQKLGLLAILTGVLNFVGNQDVVVG